MAELKEWMIKISDSSAIEKLLNEVFLLRSEVNAMKRVLNESPLHQNFYDDVEQAQSDELEDLQVNHPFLDDYWNQKMDELFD